MLLKASHLMILVNRLGDHAAVSAPTLGCQLFALDLSAREARIHDIVSSTEYQSRCQDVRSRASKAASGAPPAHRANLARSLAAEVPELGRLRDTLRQAGLIEPENLSAIRALLRQARASNPARGGDIYYFAFDNNALRNRLYSQVLKPQLPRDPHFNFVIAKQVRNELDCRDGKILGEFEKGLDSLLPRFSVGAVFQNQNRLQDRLRLLALSELNQLLASGDSETAVTGEEKAGAPPDSDRIIIAAYERFSNQAGRKVILFSSDNEFVVQSSSRANLFGQLVRYPSQTFNEYVTSWEGVCRLLYQLAVVYGRLDLHLSNGDRVLVYGVWQFKTSEDWEKENVRVTMDSSSSYRLAEIHDAVARDLAVLEEVAAKLPA